MACAMTGAASTDIKITDLSAEKSTSNVIVSMHVDASEAKTGSDREVKYVPLITDGVNTLSLTPVIVAGRNRYIQNQRHSTPAYLLRSGRSMEYSVVVPFEDWMANSELKVTADECNCGRLSGESETISLMALNFGEPKKEVFEPRFTFVLPEAKAKKTRTQSGSAYIDFPVNQTVIRPDYRRNPEELASIRKSIDLVKNDADATITSVRIEGFASPEGPYANNERLAAGRADALTNYVKSLYNFPADVMGTSWVAENWEGLRQYVESSSMPGKEGILAIIADTALAPDAREQQIKQKYPEQYRMLLADVYPSLRKSDYAIDYELRVFTDPEEIKKLMTTAPQKLDLNEIYLAANIMDPGSEEYLEAIELAVRMYPNDAAANLNMSVIALQRGELERAATYLQKAGTSPRAGYARGVLKIKQGDTTGGLELIRKAAEAGLPEAVETLGSLSPATSPTE